MIQNNITVQCDGPYCSEVADVEVSIVNGGLLQLKLPGHFIEYKKETLCPFCAGKETKAGTFPFRKDKNKEVQIVRVMEYNAPFLDLWSNGHVVLEPCRVFGDSMSYGVYRVEGNLLVGATAHLGQFIVKEDDDTYFVLSALDIFNKFDRKVL